MANRQSNPGFQHPVTRVLLGIGAVAMLISGIMDLTDTGEESVSLVLKLVAVVFFGAALGYGITQNKKLQAQQWQTPPPYGVPGHGPGQPGPYPPPGQYPPPGPGESPTHPDQRNR